MLATVIWVGIGFATLLLVLQMLRQMAWRRACRAGAAKIHADLLATFKGMHQYQPAGRTQFVHLDWTSYDEAAAVLKARGFKLLGGIEDVTVSRVNPDARTLIEIHATADGSIAIAAE